MSAVDRREYLRRLLGPMWLRPESALWYAHEAYLARAYLGDTLASPSLEFGCMDGVSTFVMLGGRFDPAFDVYGEVSWDSDSHRWQSRADDYFDRVDSEVAAPSIAEMPADRFDVGLDWKRSHLEKAARLGIHAELIENDPGQGLEPLDDGRFALVWAPNLYWMEDLGAVLGELRRVLAPGGRLVTVLPDRAALDHMLYRFVDQADPEWIRNLDRGRHANIARNARSSAEWESLFGESGLTASRHEMFLPRTVFQVNDIGLRPMFPVLMDIHEALRTQGEENLLRIKERWIDVVHDFLAPLCDVEWMEELSIPSVWHIFELEPAGS